ncbi:hypothetical protein C8J56DRAFT_895013 [Mycena floridula]|nr:hypothetical protein C8J56DRAFT_895013 [Mycena floridula]
MEILSMLVTRRKTTTLQNIGSRVQGRPRLTWTPRGSIRVVDETHLFNRKVYDSSQRPLQVHAVDSIQLLIDYNQCGQGKGPPHLHRCHRDYTENGNWETRLELKVPTEGHLRSQGPRAYPSHASELHQIDWGHRSAPHNGMVIDHDWQYKPFHDRSSYFTKAEFEIRWGSILSYKPQATKWDLGRVKTVRGSAKDFESGARKSSSSVQRSLDFVTEEAELLFTKTVVKDHDEKR